MYPYEIELAAAEFQLQQLNESQERHQLRQQRLHHPLQQQQRSHLPSFSPISPPPPPPPPTYNNPPPHSGSPFPLFDSLGLSRTPPPPPPQTSIKVHPTNSSFLTISNHHPNTLQFNFFPNTTNNDGFALPLSPVSTFSSTNSTMSPMPPSPFFNLNNNNTQNLINNQWFPPTPPPPPPPPSLHFNPSPNFMGLGQFEQTSGGFTQLLGMELPSSQSTTTTTTPTSFNYHATNNEDVEYVAVEPLLLIPQENIGLLDDMLMESKALLSKEKSKRNNEVVAKGFGNKGKDVMIDEFIMVDSTTHHQFNDSSSAHSSLGMKSTPTLPMEPEMDAFEDDEVLNSLLEGFSDSSNGQSSSMEGDNFACWTSS